MPDPQLLELYTQAQAEYSRVGQTLASLAERMALESIIDVLPTAHSIEVLGGYNEDWVPLLRIQRVLSADGSVLFDISEGHPDRAVEDAVDTVDVEYLDMLIELTGDEYLATKTLDLEAALQP